MYAGREQAWEAEARGRPVVELPPVQLLGTEGDSWGFGAALASIGWLVGWLGSWLCAAVVCVYVCVLHHF